MAESAQNASPPPQGLAKVGVRLQQSVNGLNAAAARSPLKSMLLGLVLAGGIVIGGLITFIIIWGILVGFFA